MSMSLNISMITGAGGMDCKTLTHFLLNKGYKVIQTYRRNSFFDVEKMKSLYTEDLKNNPSSELFFEVCDISCQNSVNECIKSVLKNHSRIDELYHLAANSHVGESFKNKELSINVNGMSHYYFLECLKNYSPKTKYYGALTSELFGGTTDNIKLNEDSVWHLRSPYSIGKALAGHWIDFYRESKDSNLFCCYGILMNHSNNYRSKDFIIRTITNGAAKIALGKEKELRIGHLNWARDEHWADFGVEQMFRILQLDNPENFVIGNDESHIGEEYVERAFGHFNLDWKKYIKFDEKLVRPNEVVNLISDSRKAQKMLGWKTNRMPFSDHIKLMCQYDYELESGNNPKRPDVFKLYPV